MSSKTIEMSPTTTVVDVKLQGRQVIRRARELYLRDDISCGSELCFESSCSDKIRKLPKELPFYIFPLMDIIQDYLPIIEVSQLKGFVFLQSVMRIPSNLKFIRRVNKIVSDAKRSSMFYPNEFSSSTYITRNTSWDFVRYQAELAFSAVKWYYEHLGGQKSIILLTENDSLKRLFDPRGFSISCMSLGEYLYTHFSHDSILKTSYETIKLELSSSLTDNKNSLFEDYIKTDSWENLSGPGGLVIGILRVNKYLNTKEAFVTDGRTQKEIFIPGWIYRNRAVHGDLVAVKLLPRNEWRKKCDKLSSISGEVVKEDDWTTSEDPCGKVVGIVKRNWREYVASINEDEDKQLTRSKVLVIPFDSRIPKIRILTSKNLSSERFVVRIDNWPANSRYPNGHFVRELGVIGDLQTEIDSILLENGIEVTPFSQGVLDEMPDGSNWTPDPEEVSKRRDLRNSHFIMSIDPPGCTDVDDALSVKKLKNGNIELGVHIADVTYFVEAGSLTDKEALSRATTVYLADRRYEMLPNVLSSNLCSLLGNRDRYAVSVLWELDSSNPSTVISVWYGRTLIKSKYKLMYETAQAVIDGEVSPDGLRLLIPELFTLKGQNLTQSVDKLKQSLLLLSKIASRIQSDREKNGALSLESTEVVFEFEKTNLEDLKPKAHLPIHETVAECMILANHWVAKKISDSYPDFSLLRKHDEPKQDFFDELKKSASSKGWKIDSYSNKALANSLNRCSDPSDSLINTLLRNMATMAMVQAEYFSTGLESRESWSHYGLALDRYTHFTSPIRRYADIIVHRLLLNVIHDQDWWNRSGGDLKLTTKEVGAICEHINDRNRAAQNAQRSSVSLFQTLYFKDKDPMDPRCIADGIICNIKRNGFIAFVPRYGIKGSVHLQDPEENTVLWFNKRNKSTSVLKSSWETGTIEVNSNGTGITVTTDKGYKKFKLFDHVTLCLAVKGSENHSKYITFTMIAPYGLKTGSTDEIKDLFSKVKLEEEERKEIINESSEMSTSETNSNGIYSFFKQIKNSSVVITT